MNSVSSNTGRPAMAAAVDGDMPTTTRPEDRGGAFGKAGLGWSIFQFARDPYYILIIIYIFAPYLARDVVGGNALASGQFAHLSPEEAKTAADAHGLAFVAGVTKWAGLAAALSAPILGAALDRGGKRKPLLLLILSVLGFFSWMLWFVRPGEEGIALFWGASFIVIASVCYTYSEVIHNAMLSDAGRPEVLPQISGNALSMANFASTLLMLGIVLCFALPAMIGWPLSSPMFGINVDEYEHYRIAGPICAIWLAVFIWPFFKYSPDAGIKGASWITAIREGMAGIWQTLKRAKDYKEVMKFLFVRMIYADGMTALLTLGAVYVASQLGWGILEMVIYAVIVSIAATLGAFAAGFLDRALGARNALLVELAGLVVILFIAISITQEAIFYGLIESRSLNNWVVMSDLHDWVYLVNSAFMGLFAVGCISSSRSMLVAMSPDHMTGEFFGLYAISGTVTVWLGPWIVETFTRAFNSQRIGMSTISILFAVGLIGLLFVRYEKPGSAKG